MESMDLWIHRLAKLSLGIRWPIDGSIKCWPIDGSIKCPAQSIKRADPSNARDIYMSMGGAIYATNEPDYH